MSWRRVRKGFLGIAAVGAIATASAALAGENDLEKSMEKALEDLQPLLVALINSDYESAVGNVEPILKHASGLPKLIPGSAKARKDEYLAYTYNLTQNAAILKTLVTVLAHEENAAKDATGSKIDHFPVVAATHYGGIVSMCVACHSSFRIALEP
jgi:hypothetical protein